MPRETYVLRDGNLVPKHLAAPLVREDGRGPCVHSDHMAPIQSMADGRTYDSKSAYMRGLAEASARSGRDYQIVGNDHGSLMREAPMAAPRGVERDVARTLERMHG